jgi:hypothetical protein
MTTRFTKATDLIFEAYPKTPFTTENWCYPYLSYGEPHSYFYGEIWTSGMDWTKDFWIVYSKRCDTPVAEHLMHFSNNENLINRGDMREILVGILALLSEYNNVWIPDIKVFISPTDCRKDGYTKCIFQHASQSMVEFWVNDKFLKFLRS